MDKKKTTEELEHLNQLARIDDEIEVRRRGIKHLQAIKRRIKRKMNGRNKRETQNRKQAQNAEQNA